MNDLFEPLAKLMMVVGGIVAFILLLIFVVTPLFKGVGKGIGYGFSGIGWFFMHIFDFIGGTLGDIVRFIGSLLAMIVLVPLVPLNVVIGRWSGACHFAEGVKREFQVAGACVYRAVIRRPLKLVLLDGMLEGVEQRVPEAVWGAPGSDNPSRRTGQFDGYTILGSLRAGGSGAKLYVAEPTPEKARKFRGMPQRVVIKSFALTEGSSLPQIVRESRALECAKQLGHVFDHGMDDHRFFYVMPYHPGDHLGILARQMHGECGGRGLDQAHLLRAVSYTRDLLATLSSYHKGGLWHKDVKPENIIVHDEQAHLVDLGLITPLRSAMTLTTHGTEYFRDPEMVRQALRGVKVHQVDGAKFDIYAVGAVLYFLIENTFPAHGGLSRFATPSPEALRWIVRRAMTEYNQRYSTADEMLADVDHVLAASNAFAVKPAELPSMRGVDAPAADPAVYTASAGTPGAEVFGVSAGVGAAGPFMRAGHFKVDDQGNPLPREGAGSASKPRVKVTNWWTGEYVLEDPAAAAAGAAGAAENLAGDFRKQAYAFRDQAAEMGRQARIGAVSARRAAKEQIKAARARARDIRARAKMHRRGMPFHRTRGAKTAAVFAAIAMFTVFAASMSSIRRSRDVRSIAAPVQVAGPRVLIVPDVNLTIDNEVKKYLRSVESSQSDKGYEIVVDDAAASMIAPLVAKWKVEPNGPADRVLEDLMEQHNVYAVDFVTRTVTTGKKAKLTHQLVYSTRKNADQRHDQPAPTLPATMTPPTSSLAYLLINDHPAKADPKVARRIDQLMKTWTEAGWKILVNDDVEVKTRALLPAGPLNQAAKLPAGLQGVLTEASLGGILRIDSRPGDGAPEDRIAVSRIDVESLTPPVPPASPDAPALPGVEIEVKDVAAHAASPTATAPAGVVVNH